MIEDLFKYLLICGNSENKAKLESTSLPYTFYTMPRKLKNYRIYGNTVNGKSVGDKTINLFDKSTVTDYKGITNGQIIDSPTWFISDYIPVIPRKKYIAINSGKAALGFTEKGGTSYNLFESGIGLDTGLTIPSDINFIIINGQINKKDEIVLIEGSTPPQTYEPYGYKIPVTINEQTTNIYLDRPLAYGDYIDYQTQKRHNADGTIESVTLPEIAIYDGENEISVDTTVQPSKIYLQGQISETEVLSSRSLQSSPQMLDRSEFQLNDFEQENIVDKMSVDEFERENSVDKMPVNELELKKIGDDENAE